MRWQIIYELFIVDSNASRVPFFSIHGKSLPIFFNSMSSAIQKNFDEHDPSNIHQWPIHFSGAFPVIRLTLMQCSHQCNGRSSPRSSFVPWVASLLRPQLLKMAIEIVDFPMKNGDFPSFFVNVYQRVPCLPPHLSSYWGWLYYGLCMALPHYDVLLAEHHGPMIDDWWAFSGFKQAYWWKDLGMAEWNPYEVISQSHHP